MKKIFFTFFLTLCTALVFAQPQFVAKGKIEYEKKENLQKLLESYNDDNDGGDNSFLDAIKKTLPQFKISYYNLWFDENRSLYKAGRENDQKIPEWFARNVSENVIYNDFSTQQTTSQKTFFDNTFLLTDTTRRINWRITNEVRTIAGFECRKATAIILDSIYVIAFYTDQILASSGPESFSGLPGMILGVALPRLNTSWFATKLELTPVAVPELALPAKGKKMTPTDFKKKLADSMKDWGKFGKRNMILVSI